MKSFRSNIFKSKKKRSRSKTAIITKKQYKYLFKCIFCNEERKFKDFLDAYAQGYYLPHTPVYCPNGACGGEMHEIDI